MSRWLTRSTRCAALLALLLMMLTASAQQPVVRGVFFYSPNCGHCHEVITNHWPAIESEFGTQLQVLFINVSAPYGSSLMTRTTQTLNIDSNGVPMLVIGDTVLVGSRDIPELAPQIIRDGLAAGGVDLPNVAGLQDAFDLAYAETLEAQGESATTTLPAPPTLAERLNADPANYLAIAVLVGLLISAIVALVALANPKLAQRIRGPMGHTVAQVILVVAGLFVLSLMQGSRENEAVVVLAGTVFALLALLGWRISRAGNSNLNLQQLLPLIAGAGVVVAGYLAYVETTLTEATCGLIGDCNTVQQSPYAQIFGVPIGMIGIVGYIAILVVWFYKRTAPQDRRADLVLFGMALFGVLFSMYLTFLEPFVIGATCVWCLTSAVLMALLLWLSIPDAREAIQAPQRK